MADTCTCGCNTVTTATATDEACACGCGEPAQPLPREEEIRTLREIEQAVQRRLAQLDAS